MKDLKITIVQSILHWEAIDANLAMFDEILAEVDSSTDLIVLPEMFTTGFTMKAEELAEPMNGKAVSWMTEKAKQLDAVVTGSVVIVEDGKYYNRLIWMKPDGSFETYDKRHLFAMADEHKTYEQGKEKLIVEYKGWKICPLICYDLRFPVWARNAEDYDLLIYTANWPKMRSFHWKTLLKARAIENQCYVLGINRCGTDGKGLPYSGDSAVINPYGEADHEIVDEAVAYTQILSTEYLAKIRKKLPFLIDKDTFEVKV